MFIRRPVLRRRLPATRRQETSSVRQPWRGTAGRMTQPATAGSDSFTTAAVTIGGIQFSLPSMGEEPKSTEALESGEGSQNTTAATRSTEHAEKVVVTADHCRTNDGGEALAFVPSSSSSSLVGNLPAVESCLSALSQTPERLPSPTSISVALRTLCAVVRRSGIRRQQAVAAFQYVNNILAAVDSNRGCALRDRQQLFVTDLNGDAVAATWGLLGYVLGRRHPTWRSAVVPKKFMLRLILHTKRLQQLEALTTAQAGTIMRSMLRRGTFDDTTISSLARVCLQHSSTITRRDALVTLTTLGAHWMPMQDHIRRVVHAIVLRENWSDDAKPSHPSNAPNTTVHTTMHTRCILTADVPNQQLVFILKAYAIYEVFGQPLAEILDVVVARAKENAFTAAQLSDIYAALRSHPDVSSSAVSAVAVAFLKTSAAGCTVRTLRNFFTTHLRQSAFPLWEQCFNVSAGCMISAVTHLPPSSCCEVLEQLTLASSKRFPSAVQHPIVEALARKVLDAVYVDHANNNNNENNDRGTSIPVPPRHVGKFFFAMSKLNLLPPSEVRNHRLLPPETSEKLLAMAETVLPRALTAADGGSKRINAVSALSPPVGVTDRDFVAAALCVGFYAIPASDEAVEATVGRLVQIAPRLRVDVLCNAALALGYLGVQDELPLSGVFSLFTEYSVIHAMRPEDLIGALQAVEITNYTNPEVLESLSRRALHVTSEAGLEPTYCASLLKSLTSVNACSTRVFGNIIDAVLKHWDALSTNEANHALLSEVAEAAVEQLLTMLHTKGSSFHAWWVKIRDFIIMRGHAFDAATVKRFLNAAALLASADRAVIDILCKRWLDVNDDAAVASELSTKAAAAVIPYIVSRLGYDGVDGTNTVPLHSAAVTDVDLKAHFLFEVLPRLCFTIARRAMGDLTPDDGARVLPNLLALTLTQSPHSALFVEAYRIVRALYIDAFTVDSQLLTPAAVRLKRDLDTDASVDVLSALAMYRCLDEELLGHVIPYIVRKRRYLTPTRLVATTLALVTLGHADHPVVAPPSLVAQLGMQSTAPGVGDEPINQETVRGVQAATPELRRHASTSLDLIGPEPDDEVASSSTDTATTDPESSVSTIDETSLVEEAPVEQQVTVPAVSLLLDTCERAAPLFDQPLIPALLNGVSAVGSGGLDSSLNITGNGPSGSIHLPVSLIAQLGHQAITLQRTAGKDVAIVGTDPLKEPTWMTLGRDGDGPHGRNDEPRTHRGGQLLEGEHHAMTADESSEETILSADDLMDLALDP